MSHHTNHPSLTPAMDAARRVIAEGRLKVGTDCARADNLGVATRIGMAVQEATLMAYAAEADGGAGKRALYEASTVTVGNLIHQCIGYIAADADTKTKLALARSMVSYAIAHAEFGITQGEAGAITGEQIEIIPAGAKS
jgi:hypothetical protein